MLIISKPVEVNEYCENVKDQTFIENLVQLISMIAFFLACLIELEKHEEKDECQVFKELNLMVLRK